LIVHLYEVGIAGQAVQCACAAEVAIDLIRGIDPLDGLRLYIDVGVVVLELQVALRAATLDLRDEAERAFAAVFEELAASGDEPLRAGLADGDVDGGRL
jgi:hypothetical protein